MYLIEDIEYMYQKKLDIDQLQLPEEQIIAYSVIEIEKIIWSMGNSLNEIKEMIKPN